MFISKLINYLDQIDPYYTQRLLLRKSLYVAVWITAINWLAQPSSFVAYAISAILLGSMHEAQILNTYKEKNLALVFGFFICGFGSASFYLLFPFKFILMFYVLIYFAVLNFLCTKYQPKFNMFILPAIIVNALVMSTLPAASIQIAMNMFFCVMLALVVIYIALNSHPNLYSIVWHKAFSYYLECIIEEIRHAINKVDTHTFIAGATHLNIIRAYRRLLPRAILLNTAKSIVNMRNIQLVLNHICLRDKNDIFWYGFRAHVNLYHQAVINKRPCQIFDTNESDFTHKYVYVCLNRSILNWNKICKLV